MASTDCLLRQIYSLVMPHPQGMLLIEADVMAHGIYQSYAKRSLRTLKFLVSAV